MLISPFVSIRQVAYDKGNFFRVFHFIINSFDNSQYISKVKNPVLFIHGKKDEVISHTHSE